MDRLTTPSRLELSRLDLAHSRCDSGQVGLNARVVVDQPNKKTPASPTRSPSSGLASSSDYAASVDGRRTTQSHGQGISTFHHLSAGGLARTRTRCIANVAIVPPRRTSDRALHLWTLWYPPSEAGLVECSIYGWPRVVIRESDIQGKDRGTITVAHNGSGKDSPSAR